jgi:acyl-coenzyme A thioesterase PaaI-like protein
MASDLEPILRDAIVGSPLGRLLGMELADAADDRVRVRLPFRPEVTTVGELVHGGAIGALVDVTATAAAWTRAELARGPRGTTIIQPQLLNGAKGRDWLICDPAAQVDRRLRGCGR